MHNERRQIKQKHSFYFIFYFFDAFFFQQYEPKKIWDNRFNIIIFKKCMYIIPYVFLPYTFKLKQIAFLNLH